MMMKNRKTIKCHTSIFDRIQNTEIYLKEIDSQYVFLTFTEYLEIILPSSLEVNGHRFIFLKKHE